MGREKRDEKRYPRRYPVFYGEKDFTRQGFTLDISSNGAFIQSGLLPPLDTRLHLRLSVTPERQVYFEAEVRRHRVVPPALRQIGHGGFGVRLLKPAELVAQLLPQAQLGQSHFAISFESPAQLRHAVETEIARGGLFLHSADQPVRDSAVTVELKLPFAAQQFAFPARVMQCIDTGQVRGVAIAFEDPAQVERALAPFLAG